MTNHNPQSPATWELHVLQALDAFGGRASLEEIYAEVAKIREAPGLALPNAHRATIRRTLQQSCHTAPGKRAGTWQRSSLAEEDGPSSWIPTIFRALKSFGDRDVPLAELVEKVESVRVSEGLHAGCDADELAGWVEWLCFLVDLFCPGHEPGTWRLQAVQEDYS